MRQLQLFTTAQLAAMRDRTASRRYSAEGERFRRQHERHRAWGLARRHAERLRRSPHDVSRPPTAGPMESDRCASARPTSPSPPARSVDGRCVAEPRRGRLSGVARSLRPAGDVEVAEPRRVWLSGVARSLRPAGDVEAESVRPGEESRMARRPRASAQPTVDQRWRLCPQGRRVASGPAKAGWLGGRGRRLGRDLMSIGCRARGSVGSTSWRRALHGSAPRRICPSSRNDAASVPRLSGIRRRSLVISMRRGGVMLLSASGAVRVELSERQRKNEAISRNGPPLPAPLGSPPYVGRGPPLHRCSDDSSTYNKCGRLRPELIVDSGMLSQ